MNSRTTLLRFGGELNTDDNQNVYRSLQFKNGQYKLCFHSEGDAGKTIRVRIEKLTGAKNTVLNDTVDVGGDVSLPFEVSDGWGEYRIIFFRETKNDNITVSNLGIYTLTDNEPVSVGSPIIPTTGSTTLFDLQGRPIQGEPAHHGIYIRNGKKMVMGR